LVKIFVVFKLPIGRKGSKKHSQQYRHFHWF